VFGVLAAEVSKMEEWRASSSKSAGLNCESRAEKAVGLPKLIKS